MKEKSRSIARPPRTPPREERQLLLTAYQRGHFAQAVQGATELVKRFPGHHFAYQLRGICLRKLGRDRDAMADLERANQLAPGQGDILTSLARVYLNCSYVDRAVTTLTEVLARESDNALAHALLCRARMNQGDTSLAIGHGRRAVEGADGHEARFYLSLALKHSGALPESLTHGMRALEMRLASPPGGLAGSHPRSDFDSEGNERLLWQVLAQLSAAGVHAFPMAGTLLGLVREGALLPFDKDMDLGLPYAEMKLASECLISHGWRGDDSHSGLRNPQSFVHRDTGFVVDLCGMEVEQGSGTTLGGFWMEGVPAEWNRVTEFPAMRLKQVRRQAGLVWMLDNPEDWLAALYGDWRTPDPFFDTVLCARNLRGFSLLTRCYAVHRLYSCWEGGQLPKAEAIARACLVHQPHESLWQQVIDCCDKAGATV